MSSVWTGEGPKRRRASDRVRVTLVIAVLVLLEFYLRPSLVEGRGMPDFLILALLLICLRVRAGVAAGVGLLVGFVVDVLTPARFGANMIAHLVLGAGAAWGRSVFFADNLAVRTGLFFAGTWIRNLLVLLLSGTTLPEFTAEALLWSPLQGASTAIVGMVVVLMFRDWLALRIDR